MTDTTNGGRSPSGRFVLRVPPALHRKLQKAARAAGISLNEQCIRQLAEGAAADRPLGDVIARAVRECGDHLVGVLVFGSYARGTHTPSSDIDVLLVVDHAVTRSLYQSWDVTAMKFDGLLIEPHFVKLPDLSDSITSLWAEVALEGAVLFDPSMRVSRYLTHIRGAIVRGVLERHSVQGKPYWTGAS